MGYVLHTGFLRYVNANNCFQSADMIFGSKLNVKILTICLYRLHRLRFKRYKCLVFRTRTLLVEGLQTTTKVLDCWYAIGNKKLMSKISYFAVFNVNADIRLETPSIYTILVASVTSLYFRNNLLM